MNILVQQQPAFVYTGKTDFDADKLTVLFIHGAANDHQVWLGLIDALDGLGMNTLAVDLPGHGKTFESAKTSITTYSDWIIDLLDNAGINNAVLVGHSMGSLVALDCAHRHPSRVGKLCLIGTSMPMPVAEVLMTAAHEKPDDAFDMLTRASHYVVRNADGSFPPPSAAMQATRAMLGASRPGVLANDLAACARYQLDDAALAAIATRTHIIAGSSDKLTPPASAAALAAKLPHAKLLMLENSGHAMMQDAPDALAALITGALG